ncbi:MAG: conjugal transfer protein TraN [Nitrospiraceae bacterium]|nr:conjugal transfer protein TraN [Nitrospiraceae bacterium]
MKMEYIGRITRLLVLVLVMEMISPIMSQVDVTPAFADTYVCGQDLNNDGNVSDPGETANCIGTQQGQLCPISAVDCNHVPVPVTLSGSVTIPIGQEVTITGSGNQLVFTWGTNRSVITASGATFSGSVTIVLDNWSGSSYEFSGSGDQLAIGSYYWGWPMGGGSITANGATFSGSDSLGLYYATSIVFSGSANKLIIVVNCIFFDYGYGVYRWTDTYSITLNGTQVTYTCPLGNQYSCMDNGGTMECSPNQCVDLTTNPATITQTDSNMLQNNGQTDSSGNCLGQIYIFSGRGERCEQAGVKDGFHDCCASKSSMVLADSVGGASALGTAASAVTDIYHLAQVAYYTNAILTTGGAAVTGSLSSASLAVQQAVTDGVAAGSVDAGMEAYAAALLNPTTIAISAAIYLVNYFLLQSCDQQDMEVSMLNASGYCHYVGEYCEESWPLIGCVQEAKGYCCFNSKLARIIQEQGRPQLKDFQSDGAWGTGESPNCRGFTPQEFQMIDFSKIDLSSYYGDIEKNLSTSLQKANANMEQRINSFYQNTQK